VVFAKLNGYQAWPNFRENPTPKLSTAHMNMYVLAFHNDVVTQAIAAKTVPVPDGALIVKQNPATATDAQRWR